jgi:hypothetical protein
VKRAVATGATLVLFGAGGSAHATLAPFVGAWSGHTRTLTVSRSGVAKESISDGCCDRVIRLTSRLSRPRRVGASLVATATVTRVRVFDRGAFTARHPPPRVGDRGRFTLRHGVISESLTGTIYCGARTARLGRCGA